VISYVHEARIVLWLILALNVRSHVFMFLLFDFIYLQTTGGPDSAYP